MGLKNYKEQVAVIKQANSQVEQLKSYANSMNALIISLQSLWDDNADQGTMVIVCMKLRLFIMITICFL